MIRYLCSLFRPRYRAVTHLTICGVTVRVGGRHYRSR